MLDQAEARNKKVVFVKFLDTRPERGEKLLLVEDMK
jgi:hypothetical protein